MWNYITCICHIRYNRFFIFNCKRLTNMWVSLKFQPISIHIYWCWKKIKVGRGIPMTNTILMLFSLLLQQRHSLIGIKSVTLLISLNMTISVVLETQETLEAFFKLDIIIFILKVCFIGISYHTSAKFCVWGTNVHFS